MKKFIALFGPLLLVVGFATPSIASAEYAVSQRTLAPFSGASTTLTPQQKSQVKAAVDSNPSGEKFICTGIRFESAPMSENIVVRKRAKSACDFAKTLNPALSTFYQNKPTKAKSYAGKVLLTVKTPIGASEVEQDIATPQPANEDQTPSAQSEQATSSQLNSLILSLKVESEYSSGYDRDLFKHWVDADGDGCDSREEVLIQESIAPVSIGTGCSISGGKWISSYDLLETTDPSTFDVDHMVPLKEAWDSGAWNWSMATRQAFANDLAFSHSLIAVSASSNRSKSDREPADWLPTNAEYVCEYAVAWVQVKVRWALSIDIIEKSKLLALASDCGSQPLEYSPELKTAPAPSPAPAQDSGLVSGTVSPGAFCKASDAGKRGLGTNGIIYTCKVSVTDSRLRWRQ